MKNIKKSIEKDENMLSTNKFFFYFDTYDKVNIKFLIENKYFIIDIFYEDADLRTQYKFPVNEYNKNEVFKFITNYYNTQYKLLQIEKS